MKKNPVAYFSGSRVPLEKDHSEIIVLKFLEECRRRGRDLLTFPPRGGGADARTPIVVMLPSFVHEKEERALIDALATYSRDCRNNRELSLLSNPQTDVSAFEARIESAAAKFSDLVDVETALNRLKFVERKAKKTSIGSVSDPIVDDDAFIQLVASGNIPVKPGIEVPAVRAFLCAKCVYQSYLHDQYRERLFEISEDIENERASIDAKRQAYREAKVEEDNKVTPLLKLLIGKQSVLQAAINNINDGFRKMVGDSSRLKTPFTLWSVLQQENKPKDGATIVKQGRASQVYETSVSNGAANVKFTNLTDRYESLVLSPVNLVFNDETIETAKYNICYGAKDMLDAGVDPQVRYKFYRMATSFAIAPSTMFGSMAMNIALMGPPGTGKSTLAKNMGKFAHAVGWLTSNKVVEPKPSDLISAVRGQTAVMTRTFLNSALGQMLFIDEAYALTPPGDAAGKEFADELTEFLTNHPGMIMVLVAGYVREMNDEFFTSNIGLPRRFPTRIILGDKTPMACFNAFMSQITNKLGEHPIGAINIAQFRNTQIPFFLSQASIWIPVFNILLGKRFDEKGQSIRDDPVNLLNAYYADIELIAEIYCRYLMSEGLFHKTYGSERFGDGNGAIDTQKPFDMAAIVTNVLNDWVSTKNGNNCVIENVGVMGPSDNRPSAVIRIDDMDLAACGLNIFEDFLADPVANADAAILKAKSMLESRVCLWPVTLTMGDLALFCPNVKVAIAFRPKDLNSPGKIPFSNSFSWIADPKGIQEALTTQNSTMTASALVDHAADLRKQQVTSRILNQYLSEQQQQMERIQKISDKIQSISDKQLPAVSNSPQALEGEIERLNAIINKMMSEHQPQQEKDDLIQALTAREFALVKRNKQLESNLGKKKGGVKKKKKKGRRLYSVAKKVIKAKAKGDKLRQVVDSAVKSRDEQNAAEELTEIFEECNYNELDDEGAWAYVAGEEDDISREDFIKKMERKAKCLMKVFALKEDEPNYSQKVQKIFDTADANKDSKLDKDEFKGYVIKKKVGKELKQKVKEAQLNRATNPESQKPTLKF